MTRPILIIEQRSEDGLISINSSVADPLILINILLGVMNGLVQDAQQKMELRKEAVIITGQQTKAIIT